MAKHRRVRPSKAQLVSAGLGAALFAATGFGAHVAHADTVKPEIGGVPEVAALAFNAPKEAPAAPAAAPKAAMPAKPSLTKVLGLARQQIGVSENSSGGGTKFQNWYAASKRAQETIKRDGGSTKAYLNAAWCSMFVSWVGEHTGARSSVGWDAYTVTHAKWFKNNNRWGTTPKPGAVVFFSWSGSKSLDGIAHVGFVEKDNGNGTITTIEGNTGNGKVEQRVRPKSQVVGYGYPEYGK
ncbi:CHAP domain-containing protein [Nonomuraea sp. NPDC050310]|uniref:CHAP domain-containing protein n=1 Tax=unclassified Nonomuraea TaxID=2593643 RepID=UPI0033DFA67D